MLSRRALLSLLPFPLLSGFRIDSDQSPLLCPCFPTPAHQFVWRNWDLVPALRIAAALQTDEGAVRRIARQMYLGGDCACSSVDPRMEFSVLRRNWFFVPRAQIAALLNVGDQDLDTILDRDAFYRSHLGPQRALPRIRLDPSVLSHNPIESFGNLRSQERPEPRFGFESKLAEPVKGFEAPPSAKPLVIAYPYFCPFGDVLGDPNWASYYPLGLLQKMSRSGVSAIWLHALLRDLAPDPLFQADYPFDPARSERLRQVIERCHHAGLRVYLYLNEPRGAHDSFYRHHPDMRGAPGRKGDGLWCMCTSSEQTRRFLRESSERLFLDHPGLSGAILITASENPTNCYSLTRHPACPRCSQREGSAVISEVVREIAIGAKSAKPDAHIIAWDWSWGIVEDDPQAKIIEALPEGVSLLVDFERGSEIEREGVRSQVDEYSLSTTGPSPRAAKHIRLAKQRGLPALGKAQIGTTWEIGTVPFLAVPDLVAKKIKAFQRAGLQEGMFSWTLGSCPSLNWDVLSLLLKQPEMPGESAVAQVASERYGQEAAGVVSQCWKDLAQIFEKYPFSTSIVYSSFVQEGPATPLFARPTNQPARILNSFDNLDWTSPFGAKIVADVFGDMGQQWSRVVQRLRAAETSMNGPARARAKSDLCVIEASGLYFDSIALLIHYYEMRDRQAPDVSAQRRNLVQQAKVAERFLALCQADSRIGFEASIGYMFLPLDIREKIAVCRYLLAELDAREHISAGNQEKRYHV